jgi:hypothetical protein
MQVLVDCQPLFHAARKSGDVNAQGQDNPPVGVWSKLGWASTEMGAIGLGIRGDHWWIANHSPALLNQGQLDVSAQGQDNAHVGVSSKLGWASNVRMGGLGLAMRCESWWIANHSSTLLNQGNLEMSMTKCKTTLLLGCRASLDGPTWRWEHLVLASAGTVGGLPTIA